AQEYRQTKKEILETLRKTKRVPKKVRQLIEKSLKENHWAKMKLGLRDEITTQWRETLGPEYAEYIPFVYAMQSPDEISTVLLTNPLAMRIAAETPATAKGAFENVMIWFS